jgi:hypothetical protein
LKKRLRKLLIIFCLAAFVSLVFTYPAPQTTIVKAATNSGATQIDSAGDILKNTSYTGGISIDQTKSDDNNAIWFTGSVTPKLSPGWEIWSQHTIGTDGANSCADLVAMRSPNGTNNWNSVAYTGTGISNGCGAPTTGNTVTAKFFDGKSLISDTARYQIFLYIQKTDGSSHGYIPVSNIINYVPVATKANISLTSGTYSNGTPGVLQKDTNGDIDLKLLTTLGEPFNRWSGKAGGVDWGAYKYIPCSLTISYSGGGSIELLNKQSGEIAGTGIYSAFGQTNSCGGTTMTSGLSIINGAINIPLSFYKGKFKLVNGDSTFTATLLYNWVNLPVGTSGTASISDPMKFSYNSTTGVGGSTVSAANTANDSTDSVDQANSGTSAYDQCMAYFKSTDGGFWSKVKSVVAQWTIGPPLCEMVQVIVSFAGYFCTYAVNYFLKPALGLT